MKYLDNYFSYKNNDVIFGLTPELNVFFVLDLFKKPIDFTVNLFKKELTVECL